MRTSRDTRYAPQGIPGAHLGGYQVRTCRGSKCALTTPYFAVFGADERQIGSLDFEIRTPDFIYSTRELIKMRPQRPIPRR